MDRCLIAIFLIVFVSCSDGQSSYVNHQKWQIDNWLRSNPLKDHPKSVKELNSSKITDTTIGANLIEPDYELFKFDSDGDIVYLKKFVFGSIWADVKIEYSNDGKQTVYSFYHFPDSTRKVDEKMEKSTKVGIGKFKTATIKNGQEQYIEITSYSNDGNKIFTEKQNGGKIFETRTLYYQDNKLIKGELLPESNKLMEQLYYYSSVGFLDSIIKKEKGLITSKQFFINNEFGDPTIYFELKGKDTLEYRRMYYKYDDHHNWVRRLTYWKSQNANILANFYSFPGYFIAIREIAY